MRPDRCGEVATAPVPSFVALWYLPLALVVMLSPFGDLYAGIVVVAVVMLVTVAGPLRLHCTPPIIFAGGDVLLRRAVVGYARIPVTDVASAQARPRARSGHTPRRRRDMAAWGCDLLTVPPMIVVTTAVGARYRILGVGAAHADLITTRRRAVHIAATGTWD